VRKLVYLVSAQDDLANILEYITRESGNLAIGLGFITALRSKCAKLASLPGILGRHRPDLRSDIRSSAFKGYVIFFRYEGEFLEIVNVLEGHRDIVAYYGDEMI
jgi:toxin ParE1/3/4